MADILNLKKQILPEWTLPYQEEVRKMLNEWGANLAEAEKDELDCIKWDSLHIIKGRRVPTFYVIAHDPGVGVYIHIDSGVFSLKDIDSKERSKIHEFCMSNFYNWIAPFRIILNQYGDIAVNFVIRLENIDLNFFRFLIREIHQYSFTIQEELAKEFDR